MTDFVGMNIAAAAVDKRSLAQLWNPAGSGKTLSVTSIVVVMCPAGSVPSLPADIVMQTAPMAIPNTGTIQNKNPTDEAGSVAQMNTGQLLEGPGNGVTGVAPFHEVWLDEPNVDRTYKFDPPILLPPGFGMSFRTGYDNVTAIASWQWSEA